MLKMRKVHKTKTVEQAADDHGDGQARCLVPHKVGEKCKEAV